MEQGAFCDCTNLQEITLSEKLENIERQTFDACKSLKSIIIPKNVVKIGVNAFYFCANLEKMVIQNKETSFDCSLGLCKNLTIYAQKGSCAETYAKENNIKFEAI